jgi:uncharacterized repeat protein (TIGR03803 family)
MINFRLWKKTCAIFVMSAAVAIAAPGQAFKTLASFSGVDGQYPWDAPLVQGIDGNFHATTSEGGINGGGTVYKITAAGKLSTVYNFCAQTNCADGRSPWGLVQAIDGNFYGTTEYGGGNAVCPGGCGTVFQITLGAKLTVLHSFNATDGANPLAGLVQANKGNFYGTTYQGGNSPNCPSGLGCGTVFEITAAGKLNTLYSFCAQTGCTDGELPAAGLVQGTDGNFYGTTVNGGDLTCYAPYGCGTVFKITPRGTLTTLHKFAGYPTEGAFSYTGLVQGIDGSFYGSTVDGGANDSCSSSAGYGCGTFFKITAAGALTTIYSFCTQASCADGTNPEAELVQATDGNFYGTTGFGGASVACIYGCGTVFKVTTTGKLTTIHSFNATDGYLPESALVQATNGIFYGTTFDGGANSDGTAFGLSTGLGPFVSFIQAAGKTGHIAEILGQGFPGTTGVSFNGIPASFTVVSNTFIKATVPAGATTGYVTVTTPSGKLRSNVPFHIIP